MLVQASGNRPSPLTQQWQEEEEKWMRLKGAQRYHEPHLTLSQVTALMGHFRYDWGKRCQWVGFQ